MAATNTASAQEAILRFLATAGSPVVAEAGMEPIPLVKPNYEIVSDGDRLTVEAWSADRTLFRRILAVESEAPGRVDVTIQRFGHRTGTLQFLDTARSSSEKHTRRHSRVNFREVFRRFLNRQFPGWNIAELSAEADLQRSLSPAYVRGLIRHGSETLAAIGAPDTSDPDNALTYGLIWLDYVRARSTVGGLVLLLPEGSEKTTCHRIRHLDRLSTSFGVWVRTDGWEVQVDIDDSGNISTQLLRRESDPWIPGWLRPIRELAGVETVECGEGVSLRVMGLEFVRAKGDTVMFGVGTKRPAREWNAAEIASLARELLRSRMQPGHPLHTLAPERWLESVVRRNLVTLDAGLQCAPVYGQAPMLAGGDRSVVDLLAAGTNGRLAVIELKATEDPHLPLQALEYWARVKWHQEREEFTQSGYFRDSRLMQAPPRMLLVAPALHFHPTTETLLRFFPPTLDVTRIGLTAGWRSELKIAFRATGSISPD